MGAGESLHGEVAAFRAAAGENNFRGLRLQPRGDGIAGGIDFAAARRPSAWRLEGLPSGAGEQRLHDGADARIEARRRVVIQVKARHGVLPAGQMTQSPFAALARMDADLLRLEDDDRIGRNRAGQPDVAADDGAVADDRVAADDGRVGVDGDVIADGRMPLAAEGVALLVALDVLGQAARDQTRRPGKADAVADFRRAADDDAGAVIDEEMGADVRAGMQVDAGAAVRPFGHHAGQKSDAQFVENVGHAEDGDRLDARIGEDDFLLVRRGGIALVGGLDVGLDEATHVGQFAQKIERDVLGVAARRRGACRGSWRSRACSRFCRLPSWSAVSWGRSRIETCCSAMKPGKMMWSKSCVSAATAIFEGRFAPLRCLIPPQWA